MTGDNVVVEKEEEGSKETGGGVEKGSLGDFRLPVSGHNHMTRDMKFDSCMSCQAGLFNSKLEREGLAAAVAVLSIPELVALVTAAGIEVPASAKPSTLCEQACQSTCEEKQSCKEKCETGCKEKRGTCGACPLRGCCNPISAFGSLLAAIRSIVFSWLSSVQLAFRSLASLFGIR